MACVLATAIGIVVVFWFGLILLLHAHLPVVPLSSHSNNQQGLLQLLFLRGRIRHHHQQLATKDGSNVPAVVVPPATTTTTTTGTTVTATIKQPTKYIMFIHIKEGQGIGNILNGLLAAHLFGEEFGRRVCVSTDFVGFHMAFEPVDDGILEECARFPQDGGQNLLDVPVYGDSMLLFNFGNAPNECELQNLLASSTELLFYCGNTYPRWPAVPENFFAKYYRPRKRLMAIMPWKTPPETVVHLRAPDSIIDHRVGLDNTTLHILGKILPRETFLVTNRVQWYDMFEQEYGWSHPEWEEVTHSAIATSWGSRNVTHRSNSNNNSTAAFANLTSAELKTLPMFCDWYTIAQAKRVVHTHSDFSISAIHFMNIHNSQTIMGCSEDGNLTLWEESWRRDGETPRLVDRRGDELRLC